MTEFPQVAQSDLNWLRHQVNLPEDKRQNCVFIKFAEPVPEHMTGLMLRVHLSKRKLEEGEDDFYQAEIFQPHRTVKIRPCNLCREPVEFVSPNLAFCRNRKCQNCGRPWQLGPVRGVIQVLVFPDHRVGTETRTEIVPIVTAKTPTYADIISGRVKLEDIAKPENATVFTQEQVQVDMVSACVLVLDRRYPASALVELIRTCGTLGEIEGFRIQ